jgi:hypothetical protein
MLHGCYGGAVAGDFLLRFLELSEHAPQLATSNRVHHVLMQGLAGTSLGNGRRAPCSRQTVWDAWTKFRAAAHLWAVTRMGLTDVWPTDPDRLPVFVALVEELRTRAEAHRIVGPGELWRVPDCVLLPPVTLTISPPTDWTLARAQEYSRVK